MICLDEYERPEAAQEGDSRIGLEPGSTGLSMSMTTELLFAVRYRPLRERFASPTCNEFRSGPLSIRSRVAAGVYLEPFGAVR